MSKKIVICGAGVGGLVSGALLAKRGHKVVLVDGQYKVGGYASCFRRNKTTHEVAVHFIPGFDPKTQLYQELEEIGLFDEIEFVRSPEFYNYISYMGKEVSIPDNLEEARAHLLSEFPNEAKGLNLFFDIHKDVIEFDFEFYNKSLKESNSKLKNIHESYGHFSLKEFLDAHFESDHLKCILGATFQYYHDDLSTMSFLRYVFLNSTFYKNGQFFIKGGSEKYSEFLKKYIESQNGEVLLGSFVCGIEREGDRVFSLDVMKRSNKKRIRIDGDVFIFNNSPLEVERWISNQDYLKVSGHNILPVKCSSSACSLYLEFSKNLREFGVKAYMNYIFFGQNKILDQTFGLGLVDISKIDHGLTSEEVFLATVTFLDEYKNWFMLSSDEYKDRKQEVTEEILNVLEREYPGIKSSCVRSELGTPLTMERFTNNPEGAIYGFSLENRNYFEDNIVDNNLKNAHFCSAWTSKSGIGLYPVSLEAVRVVNSILHP